jgi:D-inositol-3-phosphate glycosyltransferase
MLSVHTCPLANLGGRDTGGMNVYVRELGRELARRAIDVDIFTRLRFEGAPRIVNDVPHMRVIHLPAGPLGQISRTTLYDHIPVFAEEMDQFRAEEGLHYDLLHAHYWLSGVAGLTLKRRWDVPLVTMFHTLARVKSVHMATVLSDDDLLRARGEQRVMHGSDRIVAANRTELDDMLGHYQVDPDRITISPLGIDPAVFYPRNRLESKAQIGLRGKLVVFSVGRIEPLKGMDTLVKAAALLRDQHGWTANDLQVVIGGGPSEDDDVASMEELARLRRLAADLNLGNRVRFEGPIAQQRLPAYYCAADVCVVPSLYESFGLVAVEALACGTPVVASDVGGLALTVRDGVNGFHAPVRDERRFAEQIDQLLKDPGLRQRLGNQAAVSARDYRWSAVADRILHMYRSFGYASKSERQPFAAPAQSLCTSCGV